MWNSFLYVEKQNPRECVACRRQPQSVSLYKALCSVVHVRCSESHGPCTLLTVIDPKKTEKSCSNSFSGLIFQVLRTQRSSVSITLSVFKQNEQKVALRRWVFSASRNQPYIQHGPVCKSAPQTPTSAILWIAPIPLSCLFSNTLLAIFDILFRLRVIHRFVPNNGPKLTCGRIFEHNFTSKANLKIQSKVFLVHRFYLLINKQQQQQQRNKKNVSGKASFQLKSDRFWGIFRLFSPF